MPLQPNTFTGIISCKLGAKMAPLRFVRSTTNKPRNYTQGSSSALVGPSLPTTRSSATRRTYIYLNNIFYIYTFVIYKYKFKIIV